MEYNYIKQGDCLDLMKELDDKSVDVCFTSPPYNDNGGENVDVSENNGGNHKKYLHVERHDDWFEWQCDVIDEMLRISKKLVIYNIQGIKNNRKNLYKLIGKYSDKIHDIVIWYKPNGMPTSTPNKLSNSYEMLLLLKPKGVKGVDVNSVFYRNVIVAPTNKNKEYAKIHKAVMSKDFCDEVIKEFTSPNDIVLDPFFGMGTTGVCCLEQNRRYIGFELCQEYVDKAQERLDKIPSQSLLDLSDLD
jgi:DNA modification methylase